MSENLENAENVKKDKRDTKIYKIGIGVLAAFAVIGGTITFMNIKNDDGFDNKCSNAGNHNGKYVVYDKNNPGGYNIDTCLNKNNEPVLKTEYNWKEITIGTDNFSKDCRRNNNTVFMQYFKNDTGYRSNKYDQVFLCANKNSNTIKDAYVNKVVDKKE